MSNIRFSDRVPDLFSHPLFFVPCARFYGLVFEKHKENNFIINKIPIKNHKMKRLSFLFFMMMALGFSTSAWAQTLIINSQSDWDLLTSNPGDYTTVELNTNRVTVSSSDMVGTENAPFTGTFDGQGYTLNVNIESMTQGAAPFHYISGATIKNLTVAGSVTAGQHHGSGLVGFAWSGTNTIENCRISTNVTNNIVETNNYIGGIVGHGKGSTVRIIGCVYDGTLHSAGKIGGLLGWSDAGIDLTVINSIFDGNVQNSTNNFHPIAFKNGSVTAHGTYINCYYTKDPTFYDSVNTNNLIQIGSAGSTHVGVPYKHANTIVGNTGITVVLTGTTPYAYNVSGITGYSTYIDSNSANSGIMYNGTVYAANNDQLNLLLSYTGSGQLIRYIASNVNLNGSAVTGSQDAYTLTMPNDNIVISALIEGEEHTITVCEDFEGVEGKPYYNPSGVMPEGWYAYTTAMDTPDGQGYYYITTPHVVIGSEFSGYNYNHTPGGSQSANMESGNLAHNNIAYIVMPAIPSGQSYVSLSFWTRMESVNTGMLEVGYVTEQSPEGCNGFVKLNHNITNTKYHQNVIVDISSVPRTAYIAYKWYNVNNSYYACCIDDVCITTNPPITSIASKADWDAFCETVNYGYDYSGQTVTMTADIGSANSPVTTMCGVYTNESDTKPFSGTFDGQGHTLTINLTNQSRFAAPFKCVDGAVIEDLHVEGTIDGTGNSDGKLLAGLVGFSDGFNTIRGCRSSATITTNFGADAALAGLVAGYDGGTLTVEDCVFDGTLGGGTSNTQCSGMVGYRYGGSCLVKNSVFAPTSLNVSTANDGNTIACQSNNANITIENSYYNTLLGNAQGKQIHTITGESDVTVALDGNPTEYSASQITAYSMAYVENQGLRYKGTIIAGDDDRVYIDLDYTGNGYFFEYAANGTPIYRPYLLVIPDTDVTISATVRHINEIASVDDWNAFCVAVNKGYNYSGETVTMSADITTAVTTKAGTFAGTTFCGTFDGQGHTLTVNLPSISHEGNAPFMYIEGATIQNLVVNGTVTAGSGNVNRHAAGLVGYAWNGTNTIRNCQVNTNVNSSSDYAGGIIGHGKDSNLIMEGCVYTGQITATGSNPVGGLIGWSDNLSALTITDCLFAGTYSNSDDDAKFHPIGCTQYPNLPSDPITIANTYYTFDPTTDMDGTEHSLVYNLSNKGKHAYCITAVSPATVANAGTATEYSYSGITGYGTGIKYNNVLYAGDGDNVSLTLGGSTTGEYLTNHGTLTENGNNYTLAMEAYDTQISISDCFIPYNLSFGDDPLTWDESDEITLTWEGNDESYIVELGTIEPTTEPGIIFDQDFEHGLGNWTFVSMNDENNIGHGGGYSAGVVNSSYNAHDGSYFFRFSSYYQASNGDYNQYLISPKLSLNAASQLEFFFKKAYDDEPESLQVGYSTTTNELNAFTWKDVEDLDDFWQNNWLDLASNVRYIAFHYYGNNKHYVYLDDISIIAPVPTSTVTWETVTDNATSPYSFEGLAPYTAYKVRVSSHCGQVSDAITIPISCPFPTENEFSVTNLKPTSATVNWEGGAASYNVKYRKAYYAGTLLFEDFENGLPSGWTIVDNDGDGSKWMFEDNTTAHSGDGCMSSYSFEHNPDDWLITPRVTLKGTLKFWISSVMGSINNWQEHYAVYISTGTTAIEDFVMVGEERIASNSTNFEFKEITVDLSSYNGVMGYIAIRHYNSQNKYELDLDDVGIYVTEEAEDWISVTTTNNSLDITDLEDETTYEVQVQTVCCDEYPSEWSGSFTFTTPFGCDAPTGLTTEVTGNNQLSWTGDADTYNIQYREFDPSVPATITLTVGNIWPDGSGYQMLLDADANAYGTIIPTSGALATDCEVDQTLYDAFEYKIPTNADASCTAQNIVVNNSVTIQIPAGTYDWCIANPTSDDKIYIASDDGNVKSRQDDYVFEAGKTYEFTVKAFGPTDGVNVAITDNGNAWTTVNNVTNPYTLPDLCTGTTYQYKVQGVNCDGNGSTTEWSNAAVFTMPSFYTKHIDPYTTDGGYYLIASPIGQLNPTKVGGMLDNKYDLYYFDQTQNREWVNYKETEGNADPGFNLVCGKGYLYANSGNNGDGINLVFAGSANTAIHEVTLVHDADAEFPGMNLVGNPFAVEANIADGRDFYRLAEGGAEVMAEATNGIIQPMEGIFVHADNEEVMSFTTVSRGSQKRVIALNVSQDRGNVIDRAIIRFGESRQLPKFQLNRNHTKLYIPQNGKDYAVVSAEEQGEMPLNFKAEKNGTYSLSLSSENVAFSYLHLIDNLTGNDIDLLAGASTGSATYTFDARTTDYESRFKLVFVCGDANDDNDFAFYSNGSWVINNPSTGSGSEATLQVIDVNGRILKSESINGCPSISVKAAPGIYMFRLINGDDVKVQKIVVE